MKYLLTFLFILSISVSVFAQKRYEQYGTGIFHKDGKNSFWQNEEVPFDVYAEPDGEKLGVISYKHPYIRLHWKDSSRIEEFGSYKAFDFGPDVNPYLIWYGYEVGYFRLSYPDGKKGLWVAKKQLADHGIQNATWEKVLDNKMFSPTHIVIAEPCLNLRTAPQKSASKITCLNGRFLIEFTDKKQGSWREVKATRYKYDCFEIQKEMGDIPKDARQEILESHQGWLKIVNDQGAPFLFYHLCSS